MEGFNLKNSLVVFATFASALFFFVAALMYVSQGERVAELQLGHVDGGTQLELNPEEECALCFVESLVEIRIASIVYSGRDTEVITRMAVVPTHGVRNHLAGFQQGGAEPGEHEWKMDAHTRLEASAGERTVKSAGFLIPEGGI